MTKISYVKRIKDKGYPTSDDNYQTAHNEANKVEKKKFPQGYMRLKRIPRDKDELLATHDKKGNIKIERRMKRFRDELITHEREELNNQRRMRDKK